MWYFMCGLELIQQHFCSGHREVDKKRPASLAPPPLLLLSCLQRPDTYRRACESAPLLHRLPLDDHRGDGNVDSSLPSPSSLLLAQVQRGWGDQPPSESRGAPSDQA